MKKLKILAGILACLMLVSLLPLSAVRAADDTVAIGSAEEFLSFAESCNLDSWSRGKTFTLTADISLDGKEFTPIATFGGTFDGGGHTVSGLAVSGSYAPAGLFAAVQEGAAVRNLNVSGTVAPAGEKNVTGGIVGENRGTVENCTFSGTRCTGGIVGVNAASGVIRSCTTSGAAFGTNETGGIAGENKGLVTGCTNEMYVNIESTDPQLTLDDLNLTLPGGCILGLIGENGAGKSTLLKCLNHIYKPVAGCVLADGKDVGRMTPKERASFIGYVPQNTELCSGLTVRGLPFGKPFYPGKAPVLKESLLQRILQKWKKS